MNPPSVPTVLTNIIERKRQEVASARQACPLSAMRRQAEEMSACRPFAAALKKRTEGGDVAVIAEIKRASPSQGIIRPSYDPKAIAKSYEQAGAACLSVLTDTDFFAGKAQDLIDARAACQLPVLRKDFMVDPFQLYQARAMGADCILLIVACLDRHELHDMAVLARELGMDVLIEVHSEAELERALAVDSPLVGINNRNLHTFEVSLQTTLSLCHRVPNDRLVIAESGIHHSADITRLVDHDVRAFLIGESCMRAEDPGQQLRQLCAGAMGHRGAEED